MSREAERKRLVKLIEEAHKKYAEAIHELIMDTLKEKGRFNSKTDIDRRNMFELEADSLLENGMIVPPCKVGTPLYMIVEKRAKVTKEYFTFIKKTKLTFGNMERVIEGFGKTVFLSESEAKYALKNRRSVSLVNGHIEE